MKPAPFDYHRPVSLAETFDLLERYGDDGRILAGGQSLVPALNMRLATPRAVIDINRVPGLDGIRLTPDGLVIGALTRHETVEGPALVHEHAPLIAAAMPHVGHAAIRTRGTFGGSLALADPAAELPACVVALDATIRVASRHGRRDVAAAAFFRSVYTTALEPGEIIVEVVIPPTARRPCAATWLACCSLARIEMGVRSCELGLLALRDDDGKVFGSELERIGYAGKTDVGGRGVDAYFERLVHVNRQLDGETLEFPELDAVVWGRAMEEHEPAFQPLAHIPARDDRRWSLAMGHGFFYEERQRPERSAPIFAEEIRDTGWDYVALGHHHLRTDVSQGRVAAYYAGAPGTVLRIGFSMNDGIRVEPRPPE